jgi:UDP-N-acetylglucosamine pyrophosphorylase
MINTNAEFIMEVTDKTKADIKGGTLIGMFTAFLL